MGSSLLERNSRERENRRTNSVTEFQEDSKPMGRDFESHLLSDFEFTDEGIPAIGMI